MSFLTDAFLEAVSLIWSGGTALYTIIFRSLWVSGMAVLLGTALGMPIGAIVGATRFRGRRLVVALIHTGFALPPVVVGLLAYLILSRRGPLGGFELLFTTHAMTLAQAVLAAP